MPKKRMMRPVKINSEKNVLSFKRGLTMGASPSDASPGVRSLGMRSKPKLNKMNTIGVFQEDPLQR